MISDFRQRASPIGNDGGTARKGFRKYESEGLRPIIGTQLRISISQEIVFLKVGDFSDILNERMVEERLNDRAIILKIGWIDFGADPQRHVYPFGDFDGLIEALFWSDPSQKHQLLTWLWMEGIEVLGEAVVDRGLPI